MVDPMFESNLLTASIHAVSDLIHYLDYPVDVKDIKTGKYILNNAAAAEVSGLLPEERIGLNFYDIAQINKIKESATEKIIQADQKVVETHSTVSLTHVFLEKTGGLIIDRVVKKSILGQSNKTIGIISYAYNVTPYVSPSYLFSLYKIYYPRKKAIEQFLKHLGVVNYFRELPTEQELHTLLVMLENVVSSKYVAKIMNLSPRTIEEYKSRLRNKLELTTFNKLIFKLRTYYKHGNFNQ